MAIETNEPAAKEKSLNFLEEIVKGSRRPRRRHT